MYVVLQDMKRSDEITYISGLRLAMIFQCNKEIVFLFMTRFKF